MKENLIRKIIEVEWEMFGQIQNEGGRASCQEDPKTFVIMRKSQCATWSDDLLAAYLNDLWEAKAEGRNLLAEKYAWMMESTFPAEFAGLREELPNIADDTLKKIEEIVAEQVKWQWYVDKKYPQWRKKGRPLSTDGDQVYSTSFETYLRGELKTYSAATIDIYHKYMQDCEKNNRNLAEENLENIVKAYGYKSL